MALIIAGVLRLKSQQSKITVRNYVTVTAAEIVVVTLVKLENRNRIIIQKAIQKLNLMVNVIYGAFLPKY